MSVPPKRPPCLHHCTSEPYRFFVQAADAFHDDVVATREAPPQVAQGDGVSGQPLIEIVVQFTRDAFAFLFLGMNELAGQFAELLIHRAKRFSRRAPFGDVAGDGLEFNHAARVVESRMHRPMLPSLRAVA